MFWLRSDLKKERGKQVGCFYQQWMHIAVKTGEGFDNYYDQEANVSKELKFQLNSKLQVKKIDTW